MWPKTPDLILNDGRTPRSVMASTVSMLVYAGAGTNEARFHASASSRANAAEIGCPVFSS
jgi:hypothetical protein